MITIIIPTFERSKELIKILVNLENQVYKDKEIIVIDDNSQDHGATRHAVEECKKVMKTNILYLNTHNENYGLAQARNMGVIESMGDVLLFLDDRYILEQGSLDMISKIPEGLWGYGKKKIKGEWNGKKGFIENFSWIKKETFRSFGCFNERLNMTGGMSQEVRERCSLIGIKTMQYDVFCEEIKSSGAKNKRDQIWKAKLLLYKLNK